MEKHFGETLIRLWRLTGCCTSGCGRVSIQDGMWFSGPSQGFT